MSSRAMRSSPWLFEEFPELEGKVPWTPLGDFPTPVQKLDKLSSREGICEVWVKRDDRSSELYGGNKVRKLEFTLADAAARGKRYVLTYGGIGSNHALATTIHSRRLGLKAILILFPQPVTRHVQENLLLDAHFGAELILAKNSLEAALKTLWQIVTKRSVYVLPLGGSTALGALGFVDAMLELRRQIDAGELSEPRKIFLALGTGGTMAGLLVGAKLAGLDSQVVGVRVTSSRIGNERKVANLANRVVRLLKRHSESIPDLRFSPSDVSVVHGFYGPGYGVPTPECVEAAKIVREAEGIRLDLTYTAKAFAALLSEARSGAEGPLLFWNTFNSVDLSALAERQDPRSLPKEFQAFFEGEPSF